MVRRLTLSPDFLIRSVYLWRLCNLARPFIHSSLCLVLVLLSSSLPVVTNFKAYFFSYHAHKIWTARIYCSRLILQIASVSWSTTSVVFQFFHDGLCIFHRSHISNTIRKFYDCLPVMRSWYAYSSIGCTLHLNSFLYSITCR